LAHSTRSRSTSARALRTWTLLSLKVCRMPWLLVPSRLHRALFRSSSARLRLPDLRASTHHPRDSPMDRQLDRPAAVVEGLALEVEDAAAHAAELTVLLLPPLGPPLLLQLLLLLLLLLLLPLQRRLPVPLHESKHTHFRCKDRIRQSPDTMSPHDCTIEKACPKRHTDGQRHQPDQT
jgi:hypothetical protein